MDAENVRTALKKAIVMGKFCHPFTIAKVNLYLHLNCAIFEYHYFVQSQGISQQTN